MADFFLTVFCVFLVSSKVTEVTEVTDLSKVWRRTSYQVTIKLAERASVAVTLVC